MAERYIIHKGSKSAHCCFEYTVVDTTKPAGLNQDTVCECFELEDAELVVLALNQAEKAKGVQHG